ncbi:Hypothetical predicted protein [Mytilus galloprovincialis]|uniref:Uncharacterized protein n=1 Tax=Mytilus galloprovincialis TaxID=29158 RepID=A0A8B6EF77_MYTGA|nr:Hypothetical predicted protein [Mytilus galloprovincialis]
MLHAMIWTGLKPHLKDISGHKYDTIGNFDGLRVALRQIESDHSSRSEILPAEIKTHINKAITTQPEDEGLQEIKGLINQIHTRLDSNDKRWEQVPWNHRKKYTQPPQFLNHQISRSNDSSPISHHHGNNSHSLDNNNKIEEDIEVEEEIQKVVEDRTTIEDYEHRKNGPVKIRISNVTTRTVSIPPRAIVCEIQPVTIEPSQPITQDDETVGIMEKMEFTKSNLTR